MPSIQGSLDNFLPLIDVLVLGPENNAESRIYRALIDTGATRTTVSERLVDIHRLPLRGKMLTQSARSGPERRRAYGFRLGILCHLEGSDVEPKMPYILDHQFAAPPFQSNDCFDVLIGNDLLSIGRFVLDGSSFSFGFR